MRVAIAARRRLVLRRLVHILGPALLFGAAVALAAVGATRVWPHLGPWPLWAAVPVGLAVLAAAAAAVIRRPALLTAAAAVDQAMRLRDRLTNGVALAAKGPRPGSEPFTALALQDADAVAASADVRRALPIRFNSAWGWAPVVLAAALAVGLFVPQRTPAAPQLAHEQRRQEQREHTVAAIQQAIDEARQDIDPEQLDLATRERIEALEELERELLAGRLEPGEAMDEAIRTLDEAARREQEEAQQALAAQEAMRERLMGASRPTTEDEASPLAQALQRGDLEQARREAESLLNRRGDITPEEAQRIAQDLRQLAQALQQESPSPSGQDVTEDPSQLAEGEQPTEADPNLGEQPDDLAAGPEDETLPEPEPAQSPLEEALREQGVPPERARQLAEQPDPEQVREALQEQQVDPAVSDQLADQAEQQRRRQQAERQAEEQTKRLSEALERAAESLEEQQQQQGQQQRSEGQQESQQESGSEQAQPRQQQQQQPGQPGEQQSQEPGDQQQQRAPGEQQGSQESQSEPTQTGEQPAPSQQGEPQPQPGSDPQQQQQQQQQSPGDEQSGQPRPGDSQEELQRQPRPGQAPGQQQMPQPGQQPGSEQEQGPGQQQTDGLRQLVQELQRQQQQHNSPEQSSQNAERLRQQARRMLENATPEERQRLQRWAEQAAQEANQDGRGGGEGPRPPMPLDTPPPGEFEQDVVDARGREPESPADPRREQVIAEWYSDRPVQPGQAASESAAEAISRARRAAERDMGDRTIHPRYHDLLRQYFRRLPDAAGAPAQDAASGGAPNQAE